MKRRYGTEQVWCKQARGGSLLGVFEVDAGHEFAVGGACGGEVLVAFLKLKTQVADVLFERHDLLAELVDIAGGAEPGFTPGVGAE